MEMQLDLYNPCCAYGNAKLFQRGLLGMLCFFFVDSICSTSPPNRGTEFTVKNAWVCFCVAELLHIPPGSKDAAIFSPGVDTAVPGEPDLPLQPPFLFLHVI
jgi:hypothetical protein